MSKTFYYAKTTLPMSYFEIIAKIKNNLSGSKNVIDIDDFIISTKKEKLEYQYAVRLKDGKYILIFTSDESISSELIKYISTDYFISRDLILFKHAIEYIYG